MWTPRRVLLLVAGLAGFVAAYVVYAALLGWMDGLPPLAPENLVRIDPGILPAVPTPAEKPVDARLRQAFGPTCVETGYTIKIDLVSRGLVLAADTYEILAEDGRVMLTPFSLAVYSNRGGGETPEVSGIHCDKAFITFEQPVRQPSDMGKYRIIAAEFVSVPDLVSPDPRRGLVFLSNNRRTPEADDDVVMRTRGPILFHEDGRQDDPTLPPEARPQIWTREAVMLEDRQSKPKPATVSAQGMNVYLTPAEKGEKGKKAKPAPGGGVRVIELCSNVHMDLWTGAGGFMAAGAPKKEGPPEERVRLEITTLGPFRYDVPADKARFEILPARDANPGLPNQVVVHRHSKDGSNDQLFCDALDVFFRRRAADPKAPKPAKSGGGFEMEVDEAHATGKYVALASDAEELSAYGTDLHYSAKEKRTVLTGSPWMVAVKEGNEIRAPELVLTGFEPPGRGDGPRPEQNISASAPGPGEIYLLDRQTGRKSQQARWRDRLTFSREALDGKPSDVLTLTGAAVFEDRDHDQSLTADTLKVWIEPEQPAKGDKPAGEKSSRSGRKPSRLTAVGHVVTRAPELYVHDADTLVVNFRDGMPVSPVPVPPPAKPVVTAKPAAPAGPPAVASLAKPPASPPPPAATKPQTPAPRQIDLTARAVETFVVRNGGLNELDRLVCEGRVRVHQEAADPKSRPTDIRGQTLRMKRTNDGSILDVIDGPGEPAEVHMEKLSLLGPEIHIDQPENVARVRGAGSMRMLSTSDLNGKALEKPQPVTIHWLREMVFTGKYATFTEGVTAEQEASRMTSQNMRVTLDRNVPLSQTNRPAGEEAAKIEKVICDTGGEPDAPQVTVEERSTDEKTGLKKYQRIVAPELDFANEKGEVNAPGPGVVTILQPGTKNDFTAKGAANGPKPAAGKAPPKATTTAPPKPPELVQKLTRVEYTGWMHAVNARRYATFSDGVRVLHLPTDDVNATVDVDDPKKMPEGSMFLTCKNLKVYHSPGNGRENQMMEATDKAWVQTREFYGQADVIKFNEASNQVIFEGTADRPAVIHKLRPEGGEADTIKGEKILYRLGDNSFEINRVPGASFNID